MTPRSSTLQTLSHADGTPLALNASPPSSRPDALWFVFMHGLSSSREGEKALYFEQALTERGHGFLRFDFRGHGDSGGRFEELTLTRQLEDLQLVLDALESGACGGEPRPVVLVGSSLGALTSVWHCALHPGPVLGQILIAPAFRMLERMLTGLGDFGHERWQREGIYHFVGPWFDFKLNYDVVIDSRNYTREQLLNGTQLPTHIVHGTHDTSAPCSMSREFVKECQDGVVTLHEIEGGDHQLVGHMEVLVEQVLQHCARLGK